MNFCAEKPRFGGPPSPDEREEERRTHEQFLEMLRPLNGPSTADDAIRVHTTW